MKDLRLQSVQTMQKSKSAGKSGDFKKSRAWADLANKTNSLANNYKESFIEFKEIKKKRFPKNKNKNRQITFFK